MLCSPAFYTDECVPTCAFVSYPFTGNVFGPRSLLLSQVLYVFLFTVREYGASCYDCYLLNDHVHGVFGFAWCSDFYICVDIQH